LNWKKPPCAGITLIRFCGFDLSLCRLKREKHPGNAENEHKFIGENLEMAVTFWKEGRFTANNFFYEEN